MVRAQILGLVSSVFLLLFVLELVRRRKLKEEYSWLWLIMAVGYLLILSVPSLPEWIADITGAERPISAYTFLGIFFLFLICIQFSVRLSHLTTQNRQLAQQVAILDGELQAYMAKGEGPPDAVDVDQSSIVNDE